MSRYLVTGGAGFIGSHVARALTRQGHEAVILDNLSTGNEKNVSAAGGKVQFVRGDVTDETTVEKCVRGVSGVFHLAAFISVPASMQNPAECERINTGGTINVLEAARKAGVERVVLSSSAAVYGDAPGLPKSETHPPRPMSPYAMSKLSGEWYLRIYAGAYGMKTVSLRYFNVFGPRQDPSSQYAPVIPNFIHRLLDGKRPIIFGDGKQTRDFVFVHDVATANVLAMESEHAAGDVINIGLGHETSVLDLALMLSDVINPGLKPLHEDPRPGDIFRSVADVSLAKDLLRFVPGTDMKKGLEETAAWFRRNG